MMSLAEVKSLLGITSTTDDTRIQFAIDIVTQLIQDYTGRTLVRGIYQDTFLLPDRVLSLSEYPVEQIDSVTGLGGDYVLHHSMGIIRTSACWQTQPVVVEYVAGYDPIPADLRGVFLELVTRQLSSMGVSIGTSGAATGPAPVKSVTVGALRVDYAIAASKDGVSAGVGPLLRSVLNQYGDVLDLYRHPRVMAATP